jgi:hypothetical protein
VNDFAREGGMEARGIANVATELDMIISPNGGHLVPIVEHYGVHVCWGCMEPFDAMDRELRQIEMRPPRSTVPVAIHAKCADPSKRKIFSDMGGSRELQSVAEVARGIRMRRAVAKVVKASADIASAAADKLLKL